MMVLYIPASGKNSRNYYYEFSLCEYDQIPIVFVATDIQKNLYLCECTDMRFGEQNWTIATTTARTIRELIDQRITLYEALKRGTSIVVVTCDLSQKSFTHRIATFDELTIEEKPEEDSYVWISNDQIESDLIKLLLNLSRTRSQPTPVHSRNEQVYARAYTDNSVTWKMGYFTLNKNISTDEKTYINVKNTNGAEAA